MDTGTQGPGITGHPEADLESLGLLPSPAGVFSGLRTLGWAFPQLLPLCPRQEQGHEQGHEMLSVFMLPLDPTPEGKMKPG